MNKCCTELTCPQLTYKALDDIIYSTKETLCDYMDAHLSDQDYGYSCIDNAWSKYEKLRSDLKSLELYRFQSHYNGDPCLCPEEIQTIVERVLDKVGDCNDGIRTDMVIDDSNLLDWRVNNPFCIPRQAWEDAIYQKCSPITFNIEVIKNIADCSCEDNCDITFDLVAFIDAVGKCEIRYDIEKTKPVDCIIEYKLLKEILPSCDITFTTYSKLRDCGIDYKLIEETASCGISFCINTETDCPEITYNLKSFPICDWPNGISATLDI